jgi:AcrR family transcriptional regulator
MEGERDNRNTILGIALGLFAERGYEAVGVAELCEASDVTKPTLYHYFGSKRGLLDTIVQERGSPLLSRVTQAAKAFSPREVPEVLAGIALAFAKHAKTDEAFARLRLTLAFAPVSSEGGEAMKALNEALFDQVEAFFRSAAGFHGNMKGRSEPYAAAFIGTVDTYVGLYLAKRSSLSDEVVKGAVRQFMYGIFS